MDDTGPNAMPQTGQQAPDRPLRVAVAFFGITRALALTLPSIRQCILEPARAIAGEMRTFGHFFTQDRIDNRRSGESGALDPEEFRLLMLDEVETEAPGACLEKHDFERMKRFGDAYRDGFASLSNLVHQLHSLDRVTRLARAWQPDVVVFARPDLYYHDSFGPWLAGIGVGQDTLFLPDWGWNEGRNDRFAIAAGDRAIAAYGGRVQRILRFCRLGRQAHSETLLKFAVKGVPQRPVPLRANRVRSNETVVMESFDKRSRSRLQTVPFTTFLAGLPLPPEGATP